MRKCLKITLCNFSLWNCNLFIYLFCYMQNLNKLVNFCEKLQDFIYKIATFMLNLKPLKKKKLQNLLIRIEILPSHLYHKIF